MKKSLLVVMVCLAFMAFVFGCKSETPKQAEAPKPVAAPAATPTPAPPAVAGGTVLGVSVSEIVSVVNGWSIKKQILGKDVYNDKGEKIGKVDDLIVSPDKAISYAIIGAGGFLGIDRNDVAIPVNQFKIADGKITLPGATKDVIKAMPPFQYAK
ncbi:MAG: PRC-barrel domain-containing protein [Deltaproteobacteria bacterium]|nr:PRC-barrel domain-containing protein [Deltaproteobacteria bacterium]